MVLLAAVGEPETAMPKPPFTANLASPPCALVLCIVNRALLPEVRSRSAAPFDEFDHGVVVPIPTLLAKLATALLVMVRAAEVEVASAVEVAKKRLLLMERIVHAKFAGFVSTSASWGAAALADVRT